MRKFLSALSVAALLVAGSPAAGQGDDDPATAPDERFGALVDRLLERLEPGLNELREFMGDMRGWHLPEVLPNGDILIRRRRPPQSVPDGEAPASEPFEL